MNHFIVWTNFLVICSNKIFSSTFLKRCQEIFRHFQKQFHHGIKIFACSEFNQFFIEITDSLQTVRDVLIINVLVQWGKVNTSYLKSYNCFNICGTQIGIRSNKVHFGSLVQRFMAVKPVIITVHFGIHAAQWQNY